MPNEVPFVDVVGVGTNATDTVIQLPHFPDFNSKVEFTSSAVLPGGQVATAMVACAKWGLAARYVGKVGDDSAALLQRTEMDRAHVESHWIEVKDCDSQSSYVLVDQGTGERTILWRRDPRLELSPSELNPDWIIKSKLLHVDGHDCTAVSEAARWARAAGIPVTADLDNIYPGVEALLENLDYLISSREFPERLTGESDLLKSLPAIFRRFSLRLAAATLGHAGVLAWDGRAFHYAPSFAIDPQDTTGAGDVFHASFVYSLIRAGVSGVTAENPSALKEALEFSCAAAGLACTEVGARSGIPTLDQIAELMRRGRKNPSYYSQPTLENAGRLP